MDLLGASFERYRNDVRDQGFTGKVKLAAAQVQELCLVALDFLDHSIAANRRKDGLYHSYNLLEFSAEESDIHNVELHPLQEMLEGQVAVLSAGVLKASESVALVDRLFDSELYRPDQKSFLLYPDSGLPGFLERNTIPEKSIQSVALLQQMVDAGEASILQKDALGVFRFNGDIENSDDVGMALESLARQSPWEESVRRDREAVLQVFEDVFEHESFTGRSGTMYAYEGLGSVYWHMVAKLLLAVQENLHSAIAKKAPAAIIEQLKANYYRIRSGLGFQKSVTEFGAIPTDPYSHTPSHAGAQQPGMTGQVKEEILTRLGELGVHVVNGALSFDPALLCRDEFLQSEARFE